MNSTTSNGLARDHMDGMLRSFFRKEMPDPWPQCSAAVQAPASRRSWYHSLGRLALVASVAILLAGYLFLAALFPVASEQGLMLDRSQTIGSKLGPKQRVLTPGGMEHFQWNETPREGLRPLDNSRK